MNTPAKNIVTQHPGIRLVTAVAAMSFSCCGAARGAADWDGAKVAQADLLAGETKHGKRVYLTSKAGGLVAVIDGVVQPGVDGDMQPWRQPPVFSADGSSVGYVDGKADEIELDALVGGMLFSDDSNRLTYGGRRGNKCFLVVDEQKGADYEALGNFGFSPDGKHIAFVANLP